LAGREEMKKCGGQNIASAARILKAGRRICIVLEMGHLLGTLVEKAAWLLLE
jgi:hypothetical protein